ncbi:hypothetical protein SAMN05421875_11429 [Acidovorax soli]|uniref:Uncharacterized protein n=1 Tax=Acidovorax soli TaxID=592050 RepID=A0A1H4BET0_9BURK|nr:hypothetical protein SAMN05421875_11429 [Acidovorax soli]
MEPQRIAAIQGRPLDAVGSDTQRCWLSLLDMPRRPIPKAQWTITRSAKRPMPAFTPACRIFLLLR